MSRAISLVLWLVIVAPIVYLALTWLMGDDR